jgi:hypothetical protein
MAASSMSTVPPPPGGPLPQPPPNGADAAPAPAAPSPQLDQGSKLALNVVQTLRQLGQMFPAAVPGVTKVNDIIRNEIMPKIMAGAKPSEPAAPPTPSA